jgi:predicted RNA-binding Zn-ribbon protein involved in translation (DUF1610 family)
MFHDLRGLISKTESLHAVSARKFLVENPLGVFILAIFSGLATAGIIAVWSQVRTGSLTSYFTNIPQLYWLVVGVILLMIVILGLVRARLRAISPRGVFVAIPENPPGGWQDVSEMNYAGVKWKIQLPRRAPWEYPDTHARNLRSDRMQVAVPPRCPSCGTELEQSKSFFWGYKWKCPSCGFSKRNGRSYYDERESVERIARRQMETQTS